MHDFFHLIHLFARKRFSSSVSCKKSQSSLKTFNNQLLQEVINVQYNNFKYEICLKQKGSYMCKSILDITDMNRNFCQILLEKKQ